MVILQFVSLSRGRYGCPLSPYLFTLAVEPLADAIKRNNDIIGFQVDGYYLKIFQFADDTTIFLGLRNIYVIP